MCDAKTPRVSFCIILFQIIKVFYPAAFATSTFHTLEEGAGGASQNAAKHNPKLRKIYYFYTPDQGSAER